MRARGQALGLTVVGDEELGGLAPGHAPGGRTVELHPVGAAELDERWDAGRPQSVVERRAPDGALLARIDRDDAVGYRIEVAEHGRHLIAPDGRTVHSDDRDAPAPRRLRLLYAQVLPLAATLQGQEVLHAGAVASDGRAVALVAPGGAGKSTLMARLVAEGAEFVTDDALAVTVQDGVAVAHPGPRFASVPEAELEALPAEGRRRLGPSLGASDKPHVAPAGIERAVPIAALALVVRDDTGPPSVSPAPGDPRELLGATFVPYVRDAARLARQLEVCSLLSRSAAVWRVSIPLGAPAAAVAALLRDAVLAA